MESFNVLVLDNEVQVQGYFEFGKLGLFYFEI